MSLLESGEQLDLYQSAREDLRCHPRVKTEENAYAFIFTLCLGYEGVAGYGCQAMNVCGWWWWWWWLGTRSLIGWRVCVTFETDSGSAAQQSDS